MVPSLEERRRRFRHLAETHPGLVVASALVDDVKPSALEPEWVQEAGSPKRRPGPKKPTQLQFDLWSKPQVER
jgi:hypothetical protein